MDGMKLDPDSKKCMVALKNAKKCEELKEKGNDFLKSDNFDQAIKAYTEAIELDPYNAKLNSVIYANRGLVFSKMRKLDEAIKDFNSSIELNSTYYKAYLRRGEAYNSNGDFEAA